MTKPPCPNFVQRTRNAAAAVMQNVSFFVIFFSSQDGCVMCAPRAACASRAWPSRLGTRASSTLIASLDKLHQDGLVHFAPTTAARSARAPQDHHQAKDAYPGEFGSKVDVSMACARCASRGWARRSVLASGEPTTRLSGPGRSAPTLSATSSSTTTTLKLKAEAG